MSSRRSFLGKLLGAAVAAPLAAKALAEPKPEPIPTERMAPLRIGTSVTGCVDLALYHGGVPVKYKMHIYEGEMR